MERFGVHRDLASYKKLFNVFPKGKYVPENRLQADFFHFPRQQECALVLLSRFLYLLSFIFKKNSTMGLPLKWLLIYLFGFYPDFEIGPSYET